MPIAWARRLLAADEILDELAVDSEVVTDSALDGSSSDEAGLVVRLLGAAGSVVLLLVVGCTHVEHVLVLGLLLLLAGHFCSPPMCLSAPASALPCCCVHAQDKMSEQHDAVHAFHHHIPHTAAHGGSSGTGLIWLLIVLHVAFVGYWSE